MLIKLQDARGVFDIEADDEEDALRLVPGATLYQPETVEQDEETEIEA